MQIACFSMQCIFYLSVYSGHCMQTTKTGSGVFGYNNFHQILSIFLKLSCNCFCKTARSLEKFSMLSFQCIVLPNTADFVKGMIKSTTTAKPENQEKIIVKRFCEFRCPKVLTIPSFSISYYKSESLERSRLFFISFDNRPISIRNTFSEFIFRSILHSLSSSLAHAITIPLFAVAQEYFQLLCCTTCRQYRVVIYCYFIS